MRRRKERKRENIYIKKKKTTEQLKGATATIPDSSGV